tara:strand:+ start:1373 stop:1822 length:450 start_codon:yes stop_codon:yes gene_type:complete
MPSYTAVMFREEDGRYMGKIPVIPEITSIQKTRDVVLKDLRTRLEEKLSDLMNEGLPIPTEDWVPARTIWVTNPRRGDSVPYLASIEREQADSYTAVPTAFPELKVTGETIEEVLENLQFGIHKKLELAVSRGEHFPIQDEHDVYIIKV